MAFDPYYQWLGIPPRDQPPNYYRLLAIELFESNQDVIEHAADRQMAHLRTFQSGQHSHASQRLLNEVAQARHCLLSHDKKKQYDDQLRLEQFSQVAAPKGAPPPPLVEPHADGVIELEPLESPSPSPAATPPDPGGFRVVTDEPPAANRPTKRRPVAKPIWLHPAIIASSAVGIVLLTAMILFFAFAGSGDAEEPVARTPAESNPANPERVVPETNPPAELINPVDPVDPPPDQDDPGPGLAAPRGPQRRWPDLSPMLAQEIVAAQGVVHDEFAMCPSIEITRFVVLVEQMRRFGYRPTRMRPYLAGTKTLVAAIWRRDGLVWHRNFDLTLSQVSAAARSLQNQDYQPVDLAGYRSPAGDRYASLWARLPAETPERRLTIGLTAVEGTNQHRALRNQKFIQISHHLFVNSQDERRESMIWELNHKAPGWLNWAGNAPYYKNILRKDDLPFDVSLSIKSEKDPGLLYAGTMYRRQQRHSRVLIQMSPDEHLAESAKLANGGYAPVSIAAIAASNQPDVVTSVWHATGDLRVGGVQLATVVGSGKIEFSGEDLAAGDNTPPEEVNPPVVVHAAAQKTEPAAAELAAAQRQIQKLFAEDIRQAESPAQKVKLAAVFVKRAAENNPDPVRFGFMIEACQLATAGWDYDLAFQVLDELESQFVTDTYPRRETIMRRALGAAQNNTDRARLARLALEIAEQAARAGSFDMAIAIANHASTAARRARETELAKSARMHAKRFEDTRKLIDESLAARQSLSQTPDDPQANATVGRHLCFVQNEWAEGLGHLAKGGESILARIAQRDRKQPSTWEAKVQLADDWTKFADRAPEPDQAGGWTRARYWYESARAGVTGLPAQAIDNKLAALAAKANVGNLTGPRLAWLNRVPGLVTSYEGHTGRISAIRISRDGDTMITGADDRTLRQWDVSSGQLVREMQGLDSNVSAVAFSPDEQFILANGVSKGIGIWNRKTGNPAGVISTTSSVRDLALSAEGRYLVFAMSTGSNNVGLWDFPANRPAGSISSPGLVTSVAVSYDERIVATATSRTAGLWDSATGRQLFALNGHNASVTHIAFSPKARFIATTSSSEAMVWDPKTGRLLHSLKDIRYPRGVDFSPDGSLVAVGGWDGHLHLWSTETGEQVHNIATKQPDDSSSYVEHVRFLRDPRGIVLGYSDGKLRLWRLPD